MRIQHHCYGKERIRLTYLDRTSTPHRLFVGAVDITLEGDFEESYTQGDNRKVVATDTMKNTVYVLAREHGVQGLEQFAAVVARHFVETYDAVSSANVDIEQEAWSPMETPAEHRSGNGNGQEDSALVRTGTQMDFVSAYCSVAEPGDEQERGSIKLQWTSGIDGLQVVKTAHSGFSNFHRDRFRTLKDCDDRLFATTIRAEWFAKVDMGVEIDAEADRKRRQRVRAALLHAFARHHSLSVQETLYSMGEAVLEQIPEIDQINLQLPNQHHLLANLEPFGLDNPNMVFVGTDEPFGNIEATLQR